MGYGNIHMLPHMLKAVHSKTTFFTSYSNLIVFVCHMFSKLKLGTKTWVTLIILKFICRFGSFMISLYVFVKSPSCSECWLNVDLHSWHLYCYSLCFKMWLIKSSLLIVSKLHSLHLNFSLGVLTLSLRIFSVWIVPSSVVWIR